MYSMYYSNTSLRYLDILMAHAFNYTCTIMCISSKSHWSICQLQRIDWLSLKFFPEYLKPIAAREREVEAARVKEKAELEAIKKAEAAKGLFVCVPEICYVLWIMLWIPPRSRESPCLRCAPFLFLKPTLGRKFMGYF